MSRRTAGRIANAIGGSLSVASAPGSGTTVSGRVPVAYPAEPAGAAASQAASRRSGPNADFGM